MAKKNLKKPSVSLTRNGYMFTLSLNRNDDEADYIYIDRVVYEARDLTKGPNNDPEIKHTRIGAKSTSWSYKLGATENHPNDGYKRYYPFVNDSDSNGNPKQSDLNRRIAKVLFNVWTEGWHEYSVTTGKGKNKKKVKKKKWLKSQTVTKTYEFDNAVNPGVSLLYNEDKTSFSFIIDINDNYGIDDNKKKVATRAWGWLTKQVMGGKEVKVSDYTGKWYNRDLEAQVRELITTEISPDTPVKFIGHAYSAGPGGKSETKIATHIFAVPKVPKAPRIKKTNYLKNSEVDNSSGIYIIELDIDTGNGWYPVDDVTIQYRDQSQYKEASDNWQTAKENINSSIKKIQTDELGAVDQNKVRYFRILAKHDGNVTPGYVSGIVAYGKPESLSGVSASQDTVYGEQVLRFKWSEPSIDLYGTTPESEIITLQTYNGGRLGKEGRTRIVIYKNTVASKTPLKTIYYGSKEWQNKEWVYKIPKSDLGKDIDYCFQIRVGHDNLDPGAISDNTWLYNINVPAKCKNVQGNKQANNTTVEVTWDNPIDTDTVYNGVEIAWSTMPNAWESNSAPSTTKFDNGAMTKAYITGLSAGEIYYFWVRVYEEKDGVTNYGIWSDPSPGVFMSDKPDDPMLTLSRSWVKEGGKLSAQWSYYASGNLPQLNAQVQIKKDYYKYSFDPLANIDGEDTKCTIDLSKKVNGSYLYPAGDYQLNVVVSNEMGEAISESVKLVIAKEPTCSISSTSIVDYSFDTIIDGTDTTEARTVKALRSLPLTVNVNGDGDLNLYVYCIDEYSTEHPDSTDDIFQGDCVWTSQVEAGSYDISKIHLADNARYRVQVECVDPYTLLTAEPQYIDFEVHWEHQAITPSKSTVTINEDGTATLVPIKPEGALDTDVCDIYRTTADGRYLCCSNVAWGTPILDRLPTFGETITNSYCFCTRTDEGDESWAEIEYELEGSGIIINYGKNSVALPWNVSNDDSRSKKGEIRSHLGGSQTYYGQPFIDRSQSLNAEVVKMENEDIIEQLYDLSRYTELCYVRTSNNIGYPAVVDVSFNRDYNNQIVSISLSAKEADAGNEYLGELPET